MERHGGCIPSSEEDLLALPGIGAYTAAAIRAFAHDEPAVVLDTNIIRVLARWNNITALIDTAHGRNILRESAESFFPSTGCRAVAAALMDLGATLCTAGEPDCRACPLQGSCAAELPARLPAKSPRRVTTKITEHRAWSSAVENSISSNPPARDGKVSGSCRNSGDTPSGLPVAELAYPITRYRVTMKLHPVATASRTGLRGFNKGELEALPIPTPHRKAIGKALRAVAAD